MLRMGKVRIKKTNKLNKANIKTFSDNASHIFNEQQSAILILRVYEQTNENVKIIR